MVYSKNTSLSKRKCWRERDLLHEIHNIASLWNFFQLHLGEILTSSLLSTTSFSPRNAKPLMFLVLVKVMFSSYILCFASRQESLIQYNLVGNIYMNVGANSGNAARSVLKAHESDQVMSYFSSHDKCPYGLKYQ